MSIRDDFFAAKAKGSLWDVAVSMKRGNPLPLDADSIFESYAKLEAYAADVLAYPGQVVAVVEADATTIYYLDQNLAIKPVGVIPTGDDKTVEVTADGAISLKGAANATAGQQPRIVNKGTAEEPKLELEWYTPDNSTVAGLQATVGGLVETVNGVDGDETKPGLVAEVNALKLADIELAADIKEIADDYVKSGDIANFETKANVKEVADALAAYKTSNDKALADVKATADEAAKASDVETALADKADKSVVDAMYTNTKIDELVAGAKSYTDTEVAKKADKAAYEQTVTDLTNLTNKVNAFLEGAGTEDVIDTLQDIIEFINTHEDTDVPAILADIEALEKKVDTGDKTVSAYVTAAIDALKIGDYAKASELAALVSRVEDLEGVDYFTQSEFEAFEEVNAAAIAKAETGAIADADAKLANKLDKSDFETFKGENTAAIATAKSEAIADADGKLANKLDKDTFNTFKTENTAVIGAAKSEAIAAAAEDAATKAGQALTDAKKFVTDSYKTATDITAEISAAVSAEATIARAAEQQNATNITNLGTRVDSVSTRAEKGITDAAAADEKAVAAQTTATNAWNASQTNAGEIGKHASRISTLETFKTSHETEFSGLNDRVGAAETAITGLTNNKADKTVVNDINTRVAQIELDLNGKPAEGENEKVIGLKERLEETESLAWFNEQTIDSLEGQVGDIVNNLDTAIADLATVTDVANLAFDGMNRNAEVIGVLQEDYNTIIKTDIPDLVERITTTEDDIEVCAGDIQILRGHVDELQEDIQGLSGAMHFRGLVEEDPAADDFDTAEYELGDVVIFGDKEYVFAEIDTIVNNETVKVSKFVEFGDASGNASAITALTRRVIALEEVDHAKAHEATLKDAKDYADGLADNYATAEQGAKADTAIQSVTCEADMGIKAVQTGTDIVLSWDNNVTFVFNGGNSTGW